MLLLSFIGFVMASAAWHAWGALPGLIVGFFFVFGLGWRVLGSGLLIVWSLIAMAFSPRRSRHSQDFIDAWETCFGEFRGRAGAPPPGLFQKWYHDFKRTGEPPGAWLDRMNRTPQ